LFEAGDCVSCFPSCSLLEAGDCMSCSGAELFSGCQKISFHICSNSSFKAFISGVNKALIFQSISSTFFISSSVGCFQELKIAFI